MSSPRLTIGITTRDRPVALRRCLDSLTALSALRPEVIVFDDASSLPVAEDIEARRPVLTVRTIRDERAPGYIAGRNRLAREAAAPFVLLMDDDAAILAGETIVRAVGILQSDTAIAAIAFAQCDAAGKPWQAGMQPARSQVACRVPAFIGFAHLVRRDVFLALGGYRESFEFYGEEKDFCLRLIEAGYQTVYLPDALVIHEPDRAGRSQQRYLRYVTRNDCLSALYNERLSRLIWLLPARFALYFRMRRAWGIRDPWGWVWIGRELARLAMAALRDRAPVSRATIATWKRLRECPEPYATHASLHPCLASSPSPTHT
jgi:GT2 family glycosyltransferase